MGETTSFAILYYKHEHKIVKTSQKEPYNQNFPLLANG